MREDHGSSAQEADTQSASDAAVVSGHTPGPWSEVITESSIDLDGVTYWQDIGAESGTVVAIVPGFYGSEHVDPEAEANARLIAAAPDGLAFAVALDAHWSEDVPHGPGEPGALRIFDESTLTIWRQCRAFIAKATGAE